MIGNGFWDVAVEHNKTAVEFAIQCAQRSVIKVIW